MINAVATKQRYVRISNIDNSESNTYSIALIEFDKISDLPGGALC